MPQVPLIVTNAGMSGRACRSSGASVTLRAGGDLRATQARPSRQHAARAALAGQHRARSGTIAAPRDSEAERETEVAREI